MGMSDSECAERDCAIASWRNPSLQQHRAWAAHGTGGVVSWPRCHPLEVPPPTLQHGASPRCHIPPAQLTKAAVLGHTGALLLALGGGLADLTLEGSEEVLAKLLGHICLQVGLHEEAEALVVDGLGRAQRRMEVQS